MKAIVIDDERNALDLFISSVIDNYSVEIKMFMNEPMLAVEYLQGGNKVDVAFLDINMPKINGVDLAEQLINIQNNIKIVFISGYIYDEDKIKNRLGENLFAFCYKPYDLAIVRRIISDLNMELQNKAKLIEIRTFGNFDLFINKEVVHFSSQKSKELLALLVDAEGGVVNMGTAICKLWLDRDEYKCKILYRDAVWRLKKTLREYGVEYIVNFARAKLNIEAKGIQCDLWHYLEKSGTTYNGEYMIGYDWSTDRQEFLFSE